MKYDYIGMNLKECKIRRKVFYQGRWHVYLIPMFNGKRRIPLAQYIWLIKNPIFKDVPKDYVIHHLDGDKANNDITNLVLMHKIYHISYHQKNQEITYDETVTFFLPEDGLLLGENVSSIRCYERTDYNYEKWAVRWGETIDGTRRTRRINRYNGKPILTERDAQKVAEIIKKKVSQAENEANLCS